MKRSPRTDFRQETHNIQYSSRAIDGYKSKIVDPGAPKDYGYLAHKNRFPSIAKVIKEWNPDICNLQEIQNPNPTDGIDEVTQYSDFFGEAYDSRSFHFKPSKRRPNQYLMTANRKSLTRVIACASYHLDQWVSEGRTGTISHSKIEVKRPDREIGEIVHVFNTHFHPEQVGGMNTAKVMPHILENCIGEDYKQERITISGDFNTFLQSGGPEQVRIIKEGCGMQDAVDAATFISTNDYGQKGELATHTFYLFIYDEEALRVTHPECFDESGGFLQMPIDHVFYRNLRGIKAFVDNRTIGQLGGSKDPRLNNVTPADHFPVVVDFALTDY